MKLQCRNRRVKSFAALGRENPCGNASASTGTQVDPFQLPWSWRYAIEAIRNHPGSKNDLYDDEPTSHIELTPSLQNARKTKPVILNLFSFLPPALANFYEKGLCATL